jgi:hypothetical protein
VVPDVEAGPAPLAEIVEQLERSWPVSAVE